jgi:hypothetical protein
VSECRGVGVAEPQGQESQADRSAGWQVLSDMGEYGVQAVMASMRSRALQTEGELAGTTGNGSGDCCTGRSIDQWGLQCVGGMAERCWRGELISFKTRQDETRRDKTRESWVRVGVRDATTWMRHGNSTQAQVSHYHVLHPDVRSNQVSL